MSILTVPINRIRYLWATFAFVVLTAGPAAASVVTFAQMTQANGAQQAWSIATSTSGSTTTTTVSDSSAVFLTFSGVNGLPFSGPEAAIFTLSATSTQIGSCGVNCGAGDSFSQFGYVGDFSITDNGSDKGADLLSGVFSVTGSPSTTGAQITSNIGSGNAGFVASATAGNLNQLVLTSAFLNFIGQTQETASFALSSVTPDFALGTVTNGQGFPATGPPPFTASGVGTFSANPGPTNAAPEPAALFMLGGGLLGLGLIRRKSLVRR